MATSDYASPAQARLMRARAHGWRPKNPRKKLPSAAVAKEFVEAKDRKYSGGFAENRYADGGPVEMQMGGLLRRLLEENPEVATALRMAQRGERYDPGGTEPVQVGGLGAAIPGRTLGQVAPITTRVPTAAGPPVAPPPRRGRESPHRERLRAHKSRIADILRGEPRRVKGPKAPSGPIKEMQRGGFLGNLRLMQHPGMGGLAQMMARKTRGAPRQVPIKDRAITQGPATGVGPIPGQSLAHLRGRGVRMEPGPIRAGGPGGPLPGGGFVGPRMPDPFGGMSPEQRRQSMLEARRRGTVYDPSVDPHAGAPMRRGAPPRGGGMLGRMFGQYGRHRGAGGPRRGGIFGGLAQAMMARQGMRPGGIPRRGGQPPPVGPRGGPQFPPNLMGMYQRMRMQNRPRMGGVGGGNRVGQADQQGALARALQRGTGRPPMSRRYAFPGRR